MLYKEIELEIIDITSTGEGVAKYNNITVFVVDAIIGDKVKVKIIEKKKNYLKAEILSFIKKSDFREDFNHSTNAQELINMKYEYELLWKKKHIRDTFYKFAKVELKDFEIEKMKTPYEYRNKSTFQIRNGKIGVFKKRTHDIDETNLLINKKEVNDIVEIIRNNLKHYSSYNEKTKKGILRSLLVRINEKNQILVTIVLNEDKDISLIEKDLKEYGVKTLIKNYNTLDNNLVLGKKSEIVFGNGYIEEKIEDSEYKIDSFSFFQINTEMMKKLYSFVRELVKRNNYKRAFDFYAGMGTISNFISSFVDKVIAVESVKEAVINGEKAKKKNVEIILSKVEDIIDDFSFCNDDIIIVDPPRKGLDRSTIERLVDNNIKNLIYISCNPSSLARDVKIFLDNSYNIEEIKAFDMFSKTTHVECVVLMSRE